MNFSFFIAKNYIKLREKKNFVHIIGLIAFLSILITTASLIIALSVFNGLEDLTRNMLQTSKPDLKILPLFGKYIENSNLEKLKSFKFNKNIKIVKVIDQNILIKNEDNTIIAKLKGVDENFLFNNKMKYKIINGSFKLYEKNNPRALIGTGLRYNLNFNSYSYPLYIYYPNKIPKGILDTKKLFNKKKIFVSGIFSIDKEIDYNTIIVPISFAQKICNIENKFTSIEIYNLNDDYDLTNQIKNSLSHNFKVLDIDDQTRGFMTAIKIEKKMLFIICFSIILAGLINIFFVLTLLVITKRKDINIFLVLGANSKKIFKIFFYSGIIISFSGILCGFCLALFLIFIQKNVGIVSLGVSSSIVKYYPVKLKYLDLLISMASILSISTLASYIPSKKASYIKLNKNDLEY